MTEPEDDPVRARLERPIDVADPGAPGATDPGGAGLDGAPPRFDLATLEAGAGFPLNDIGNGRRFGLYFGDDALVVPRVAWFAWDGSRWRKDPDRLAVRRLGQQVSAIIHDEIPHLPIEPEELERLRSRGELNDRLKALDGVAERSAEEEAERAAIRERLAGIEALAKKRAVLRREHRAHAKKTGNSATIDNMLNEAQVALALPLEALDSDPLTINVENGTLRFRVIDAREDGASKVVELRFDPHARGDHLTKLIPARYDPDAVCPGFDTFFERIMPDPEMRAFLLRWFGLSMTAEPVQKLAFFHGDGANGKSALVDLIARILGDYAASVKIEALTGRNRRSGGDATPELIPLVGARFVRSSEPEEGERLQEAKIKEITSGEPMQARALHGDFFDLKSDFKLTVSGNHKPEIRGTDGGIWRRVMLVPFEQVIPPEERIPLRQLVGMLFEERAGILARLVEGLRDYLENGLQEPALVIDKTAEYRDDSDPVGQFLADCCDVGRESDWTGSAQLVEGFQFWMEENGGTRWKARTVQRGIKQKAGVWRHPRDRHVFHEAKRAGIIGYAGIALNPIFRKRLEDAPRDNQGRPIAGRSRASSSGSDDGDF